MVLNYIEASSWHLYVHPTATNSVEALSRDATECSVNTVFLPFVHLCLFFNVKRSCATCHLCNTTQLVFFFFLPFSPQTD